MNDIVNVAEALEKSPIAIVQDSCVAVRNRNATCRRCVEVCAANAVHVAGNEIDIDLSACMGCAACVAACPTEALVAQEPSDADLDMAAESALEANAGLLVFACARMSSKRRANPARYVEVACLPRIDESIVLRSVANSARGVLLVDGDCSTCKNGACTRNLDALVTDVNDLLESHGSFARVSRRTGFPDDMLEESTQGLFGTTRRGFFSEAASAAKETALSAAKVKISQDRGNAHKAPGIGERLRVTQSGTLPLVSVKRHEAALNALDAIGEPTTEFIDSRLFASVSIDANMCNACGMCAMFCPTGALKRDPAGQASSELRRLEFSAADCVQCGTCKDVCWKGALAIVQRVPSSQLYDFEPVTFDVAGARPSKGSVFGKTR